jgi:DNA repair exonuclease SbcCD nuclease subunit
MEIKKLDIGISHIDKIFHVSDIHIRTLKRHNEYREVFENMFLTIAQEATDSSICVVTGDIVHSKLDMSPELINMLTEFFNGFMIPTIVILGNHDMNLNNTHRVDALSPILNVIKNPNIHFIKENGVFEIASVLFNHMAVDVAPSEYISGNTLPPNQYKIAMHHGAVHTAMTDIGYEISNDHVTTKLFDGHDITLLGDIHKPNQILQTYQYDEIEVDESEVDSYLENGWQIK